MTRPARFLPARRSLAALAVVVALAVLEASPAGADGSAPIPLPVNQGCFGIRSYGIAMYGTGAGSVTLDPPGPILGVYLHWVGVEDTTPAGAGTSTVTVNGTSVSGLLSPPPADFAPTSSWFSWWANIGPAGGPFPGLGLVDDANRQVDVSDWTGANATNGATVTVIYDTGMCPVPTTIVVETGVDWYYYNHAGEAFTELLVFPFPPAAVDRVVSFQVAHAGTDATQTQCRGGAVWMRAGTGAAPAPAAFDLVARGGGGRGFGVNGGVEIVNDPFTAATLPCVPTVNPAPDEPYEPGHPCPAGAATCPYRALAFRPPAGGDVGAEWAVVEMEVLVPAGSTWVAFQLESEADEDGESGSYAGASYVLAPVPVCGNGILEVGEECDDGNTVDGDGCSSTCQREVVTNRPPELTCIACTLCNDPGICAADIACSAIAAVCDPDGDTVTLTCAPLGPYPVGSTPVTVTADDGETTTTLVCPVVVRDCEPPTCIPPADLALECGESCGNPASGPPIDAFLAGATGADNCAVQAIDVIAPSVFPSACVPSPGERVAWVVTDTAGFEKTCFASVRVEDTTPPEVTGCGLIGLPCALPAPPRPPGPPGSPGSPGSPLRPLRDGLQFAEAPDAARSPAGSPPAMLRVPRPPARADGPASPSCTGPTEALVRVDCGTVADACDARPDIDATVTLSWQEWSGPTCAPFTLDVPVTCGEILHLVLVPPPCPGDPPIVPVATGPDGIRVLSAEAIAFAVAASDRCGNGSSTCSLELPAPGTPLPCAPGSACPGESCPPLAP